MSANETQAVLAFFNLLICTGLGWGCLKRFTVMSRAETSVAWMLRYGCLFISALVSGFSVWLFGEWPGLGQVLTGASALFVLGFGGAWAGGQPDYAKAHGVKS